jgi:RNA polymerase sigma-70 factor (ECF subfamily)
MGPLAANGMPAFGQRGGATPDGSGYHVWAVQVLDLRGDRILGYTSFIDVETLFPMFGLPLRLDASGAPLPD